MPLRSFLFPVATRLPWPRQRLRYFHSSAARRDGSHTQNYYETLQIPTNASPSEVKKSFYTLSKTHHPDRNPSDPEASSRFVQISDAYATLGNPEKRSAYDRSISHSSHAHHNHNHRTPGSYHSSSPAGGRSPSGLSRRRTQFRGPPPSFYRSGGWGSHSAKRKAAQENGAPGAEAPPESAGGAVGGMGPGQSPFGQHGMNDVPHFDREGHFRTQENQQQRWQRRRGLDEDYVPAGDVPRSALANFLFVGGIISLGVFLPALFFERLSTKKKRRE